MIRASLYVAVSGCIWLAEGFVFSQYLAFHVWQTAVMALVYVALFLLGLAALIKQARTRHGDGTQWRYLALAPMLVVVVGGFISLPLLLVIAALGRL